MSQAIVQVSFTDESYVSGDSDVTLKMAFFETPNQFFNSSFNYPEDFTERQIISVEFNLDAYDQTDFLQLDSVRIVERIDDADTLYSHTFEYETDFTPRVIVVADFNIEGYDQTTIFPVDSIRSTVLFDDADTFYSTQFVPVPSAIELAPRTIVDVDFTIENYQQPLASIDSERSVNLLNDTDTFYSAELITLSVTVSANLLNDTDTFYSATFDSSIGDAFERINASFINDVYRTYSSFAFDSTRVVSFLQEEDQFFSPDLLNEVIFADFLDDKYLVFERIVTSQVANPALLDDSTDTFYSHDLLLFLQIVTANTVDDSTDNFFAPNFTSTVDVTANTVDDSVDSIYDARFIAGIANANTIDDSIDIIYSVDSRTRYILGNLARYQEFPLDIFYPIDVDFTQFSQVAKFNDPVEVFYSHLFVPAVLVDILDDSEDDFFNYRINYANIRSVTVIDDIVDKIYPVSFFGVTLPPVEKNTEFFFELAFDPYPAPIVSSQVVSLTVEPVNFVDSGVTLSNYPKNGSANVSAFISGKYVDLFAEKGEFKYVEQGSSDLLQTPDIAYLMRDIPDGKSIIDFNEFLYGQSDQVDYTFTVDYRLADLPEINADSNLRMIMWLDSTDTDTVVTDSNNVVIEWQDKSTFNHDANALYNVKLIPGEIKQGVDEIEDFYQTYMVSFTPGDEFNFGDYGWSTAINGNTAFVAANFEADDQGRRIGSLFVYEYDNGEWVFKQKIFPSILPKFISSYYYGFGEHMSFDGNTLVVGSPFLDYDAIQDGGTYNFSQGDNLLTGGFFIFEQNYATGLWEEKNVIIPFADSNISNLITYDEYWGLRVQISNNFIAISTDTHYYEDEQYFTSFAGGVLIYKKNLSNGNWEYFTLLEPDIESTFYGIDEAYDIDEQYFGTDISLDGNVLVVGSPNYTVERPDKEVGAIYIYEYNNSTWTRTQKIIGDSTGLEGEGFGGSVDVKNNTILVTYSFLGSSFPYDSMILIYEKSPSGTWVETFRHIFSNSDMYVEIGVGRREYDAVLSSDANYAYVSYKGDGFNSRENAIAVFSKINGNWQRLSYDISREFDYYLNLEATDAFLSVGYWDNNARIYTLKSSAQGQEFTLREDDVQTGGEPQIYYDGIVNGLPAVRHHYTNTVSHTLVSDLELTDGVTIFVVTKNNVDANSFIVMGSYIDTSNNETFANDANYGYMGYQEVSNDTDPINQNNPVINYYVNDYLIDPESPAELYQSVVDNNSNIQIYTFTLDSFETLSTGLLDLGTDLNVEKDIAEIIVYDAIIPKEDVRKIHAYLANKWGVANTKIMTEINKKYGDVTYSVTDSCGGVQIFDSSIYTYSLTLNHIVTNLDDSQGTEYLDDYLKDYAKRPDC